MTEALSKKKLTGDRRNELTRDICSSIRIHTMFPTKAEREHVAFLLIKQYPFLEDAIGSGIVCCVISSVVIYLYMYSIRLQGCLINV